MNLVLIIDTSVGFTNIVFGSEGRVIYDHRDESRPQDDRDISVLVEHGLNSIGQGLDNIKILAVNIGPGGLTAVRVGVSFASGLAYGLKVPVCPFTSFELIGFEAWKKYQLPVLCIAKGTTGRTCAGLYNEGSVSAMKFGSLEEIVIELASDLTELSVAGFHRDLVQRLLTQSKVHDSMIQVGRASTILEIEPPVTDRKIIYPNIVSPLYTLSEVFHE